MHRTKSRQIWGLAEVPKKYPHKTVSFEKGACLAKEIIGWCKYGPGSTWRIPGLSSEGKAEENATEKWSQEPQRVEGCHLKKTAASRLGKVHFLGGGFVFCG